MQTRILHFPIQRSCPLECAAAVLAVAAAAAVCQILDPTLDNDYPYTVFIIPVLLVSLKFGCRAGVFTLALTVYAADVLFVEPRGSLWVELMSDRIGLLLFVIAGLAAVYLGDRCFHRSLAVTPNEPATGNRAKTAHENLRRLQSHLLDHANDPILAYLTDGTIIYWNQGAERLYGYTSAEAIGEEYSQLVEKAYPAPLKEVENGLRQQGHWAGEVRHRTRIGKWVTVDCRMVLVEERNAARVILETNRDISDRIQAEADIRVSEARLRTFVDHAIDGLFIYDADGRIVDANSAACQSLGYSRSELTGMTRADIEVEAKPRFDAEIENRLRSREPVTLASRHRRRDGSSFPVEVCLSRFEEGGQPFVLAQVRDVTHAQRTEREAAQTLAQLQTVVSNMRDGLIIADANGNLLDWNPAALRMYGFQSVEEVRGNLSNFADAFLCLESDGRMLSFEEWPLNRVLRGETLVDYELEVTRVATGLKLIVSFAGTLVRGPNDGPDLAILTLHDVTQRRKAEAALHKSEYRFRMLVDGISDCAVYMLDPQGCIASWNSGAERLKGYKASEVIGQHVSIFFPSEDGTISRTSRMLVEAEAAGRSEYEGWRVRKDGTRFWANVILNAIYEGGRLAGFAKITRDLTERRALEEQVRQSQKMDAIGQLAGGIAHDFNNLLTVISGYSALLLGRIPPKDPNHEFLREINRAAERSASLTRQLLIFSRKQVVSPRILAINDVIAEAENMLRRMIGEDLDFNTKLVPMKSLVNADPGQLEQVLLNLCVNARDAMPAGGKLTIETKEVELDAGYCRCHADVQPGRYVQIAVSDNGSGMTQEVKNRIFEPFFTTKGVGKGTGLGLAVVHGIVKTFAGHVGVYSELGVGTTFKIYLPAMQQQAPAAGDDVIELEPTPLGYETVLLAEDEAGVRTLAREILSSLGYRVLEADNGLNALDIARDFSDTIDLLITDVVMPGMGGRVLVEEVHAIRPKTKVLFLSGYTDDAVVRHGILQDEVHFLQKPFAPNALGAKVREILDEFSPRESPRKPSFQSC